MNGHPFAVLLVCFDVAEPKLQSELGPVRFLNKLPEDFVLHIMRIFHEKLDLVNPLFHDPG